MKNLLILITVLLSVTANAKMLVYKPTASKPSISGKVLCLNVAGKYRPIGKTAIKIASRSDSNNCNSAKFKRQAINMGYYKITRLGKRALKDAYVPMVKEYVKAFGGKL